MLRNLLVGLDATTLAPVTVAINPDDDATFNELTLPNGMVTPEVWRPRILRHRFLNDWSFARAMDSESNAILFPNYFTPPRLGHARKVTIIHDLQHTHLPQYFSPRRRRWLDANMAHTLSNADAIVAISGAVRNDLLKYFGCSHEQDIHVIPNPISWDRFRRSDGSGIDRPSDIAQQTRILSVCSHFPHKNLDTLLVAFKELTTLLGTTKLILVGRAHSDQRGSRGFFDVQSRILELHLEQHVEILGAISDERLGAEYRRAAVVAVPSLFEGFGMPAVEALGLGIPVVASRLPSLVESTLGKARYVSDPKSPSDWAQALFETVSDVAARPGCDAINTIRETYNPARIAKLYLSLMNGCNT